MTSMDSKKDDSMINLVQGLYMHLNVVLRQTEKTVNLSFKHLSTKIEHDEMKTESTSTR